MQRRVGSSKQASKTVARVDSGHTAHVESSFSRRQGNRWAARGSSILLAGYALIAPTLFSADAARSAIITVDTDSDGTVGADRICSLREALVNANTNSDTTAGDCAAGAAGSDEIVFDPDVLPLTITVTSPLTITSDVTIDGPGWADVTIDSAAVGGVGTVQLFVIESAGSNPTVTLRGLHLDKGRAERGGAIRSTEALVVEDSVLSGHRAFGSDSDDDGAGATSGMGGAIYTTASLTLTNSSLVNNEAQGGAAIGTMHGLSLGGSGSGIGGAVCVNGVSAVLTVSRGHFSNNFATGGHADLNPPTFLPGGAGAGLGGAIAIVGGAASSVATSMFVGNEARGGRGGTAESFFFSNAGGNGASGFDFRGGASRLQSMGGDGDFGCGGGAGSGGGFGGFGGGGAAGAESFPGGVGGFGGGGGSGGNGVMSGDGAAFGGAIFTAASLSVRDSTMVQNQAEVAGGEISDPFGRGGAIFARAGTVTLTRSALASNTSVTGDATTGLGGCAATGTGTITSAGTNLVDSSAGCPVQTGDLTAYPGLAALPTTLPHPDAMKPATCASPLVDGAAGCAALDLLGATRPSGDACDIGAIEFVEADLAYTLTQESTASAGQPVDIELAIASDADAASVVAEISYTDLTFMSGPGTCSLVAGPMVRCTATSIPAGGSYTAALVFDVSAVPTATPTLHVAKYSSATEDCTTANDTQGLTLVLPEPEVAAAIFAGIGVLAGFERRRRAARDGSESGLAS